MCVYTYIVYKCFYKQDTETITFENSLLILQIMYNPAVQLDALFEKKSFICKLSKFINFIIFLLSTKKTLTYYEGKYQNIFVLKFHPFIDKKFLLYKMNQILPSSNTKRLSFMRFDAVCIS